MLVTLYLHKQCYNGVYAKDCDTHNQFSSQVYKKYIEFICKTNIYFICLNVAARKCNF